MLTSDEREHFRERMDMLLASSFAYLLPGIARYACSGIQPGGLLMSVLSNDLYATIGKMDPATYRALPELVIFIMDSLPDRSYGSKTAVQAWINIHQQQMEEARKAAV